MFTVRIREHSFFFPFIKKKSFFIPQKILMLKIIPSPTTIDNKDRKHGAIGFGCRCLPEQRMLTALCCNEPCPNYCFLVHCLFDFFIVMKLRWLVFTLAVCWEIMLGTILISYKWVSELEWRKEQIFSNDFKLKPSFIFIMARPETS